MINSRGQKASIDAWIAYVNDARGRHDRAVEAARDRWQANDTTENRDAYYAAIDARNAFLKTQ